MKEIKKKKENQKTTPSKRDEGGVFPVSEPQQIWQHILQSHLRKTPMGNLWKNDLTELQRVQRTGPS